MVPEQNIDVVNRESRKNVDHGCCHGGNARDREKLRGNMNDLTLFTCFMYVSHTE